MNRITVVVYDDTSDRLHSYSDVQFNGIPVQLTDAWMDRIESSRKAGRLRQSDGPYSWDSENRVIGVPHEYYT